ncbi:MAG: transcriptional regulator [Thalassolituus sp. CG17_big_fil_post_rev_8_21_14_2_50_53_8]|nr:MAG: transcriptional regulator [Thalassolituus sp. CG17_big_fil_post_rev_8_21_14_2_50_53_8]
MHVTLLLADQCSAASATMAQEIFYAANLFSGQEKPLFELSQVSLDGLPITTSAGQQLMADCGIADIRQTDLIVIPGFLFSLQQAMPEFGRYRAWLTERYRQGATIATMCNATFLLAESGLADGMRVTTHWAFAGLFRRSFPQVRLDEQQMLCEDGQLISSGGATAVLDLLLHLIRRFASLELAQTCSRYLLIDNVRSVQSPYALWAAPKNHTDQDILKVQNWLDEHFAGALVIDELASRFGFGVRNFKRRFKEATGQAPLAYLQALRIEKAKQLIESTRMTIDSITLAVGYEDSNSFRRLFRQRVGLSPAAYRKQFQPKSRAESSAE